MSRRPKLICVVGPNASGKTSLAITLARKFNGEIVSADSRQVYRGMDIGSGKATKKEQRTVKHYLLDVASPQRAYNVSHFKKDALQAIKKIHHKNKLPFLVGGTGFWVQAVVDNLDFPTVKPNKLLRRKLSKHSTTQLLKKLKKLDPQRAENIDNHNPYRLIRAIEIITSTRKPLAPLKGEPFFQTLMLGLNPPRQKLYELIDKRLERRLKAGLLNEIKRLHQQGVSWRRLYEFGLEYRYCTLYLQKKLARAQMVEQLKTAIHHYAKRQMTWFKKDKRIHWIKNQKETEQLIKRVIQNV